MYLQLRTARQTLRLGLLVTLTLLAMNACGGGDEAGRQEEEAKARHLPIEVGEVEHQE